VRYGDAIRLYACIGSDYYACDAPLEATMTDLAEKLEIAFPTPFEHTEASLRLVPAPEPEPAPEQQAATPVTEVEYAPMYYI
jgi:hypothetical protein